MVRTKRLISRVSGNPPTLFYNFVANMKTTEQEQEAMKAKASLTWLEQKVLKNNERMIDHWKVQAEKLPKEEVEAMHKAFKDGWPMEINATRIYEFALAFPCLVKFDATKYKDYTKPKPEAVAFEAKKTVSFKKDRSVKKQDRIEARKDFDQLTSTLQKMDIGDEDGVSVQFQGMALRDEDTGVVSGTASDV